MIKQIIFQNWKQYFFLLKILSFLIIPPTTFSQTPDTQTKSFKLSGTVKDEETNKPLAANISLIDENTNEIIQEFQSDTTGIYSITLELEGTYSIEIAHKTGYMYYSETFSISQKEKEKSIHIKLKRLVIHHDRRPIYITYDINDALIKEEHISFLNKGVKALKLNPQIKIQIIGHTDNLEINKKRLSIQRAKAVYNFFISKGIAKNRLRYKGYGMKMPKMNDDTPKGRRLSRRVEFKVIVFD